MKTKYIDEKFRAYFIFGHTKDGLCNISDGMEDIALVSQESAEKLVQDRDDIIAFLYKLNGSFPEQFAQIFNTL